MTIKEIDQIIEEGQSLKFLSQAYGEIASQKVRRIRAGVERNRMFFEEISYVYGMIQAIADKRKITLQKPKKTISLILTSNYRFYGNINSALIKFYIESTRLFDTARIIIGKTAAEYFKAQPTFSNVQIILLKTDYPSASELTQLASILKDYQQVLIFYSKLKSLLIQKPSTIDLSTTKQTVLNNNQTNFGAIFEPELPKILSFFDAQFITLLLEEAFLESELSRTASRLISMDQAQIKANNFIKEQKKARSYVKRSVDNILMLEAIAALRKGSSYGYKPV